MSPEPAGCVEREGFTASGRTSPTTRQNPSRRLESLSLRPGPEGPAAVHAPPSNGCELSSAYVWRFPSRTSWASHRWYVRRERKRRKRRRPGPLCGNVTGKPSTAEHRRVPALGHCGQRDEQCGSDEAFLGIDGVRQPGVGRPWPPKRRQDEHATADPGERRIVGERVVTCVNANTKTRSKKSSRGVTLCS